MNAQTTPYGPTDTNGWDSVFAIKYSDVNQAIIEKKSSPTDYTLSVDDPNYGTVSSKGTFEAWQIAEGGDGENIHMTVSITQGSITFVNKETPFTNAVATIEVNLAQLPQPGATKTSGKNDLKINLDAASSPDGHIVSVLTLTADGLDTVLIAILKTVILQAWLEANLRDFNHVFSVVDLAMTADKTPGFKFLLPTYTSYAVTDHGSLDDSIFAVLSMTENRSPSGLTHEVSPYAIPEGARAGFMITQERFLENMVLPGIAIMFLSATSKDFDIVQDGTQIINNKALDFHDWILDDGTVVSPVIDKGNFNITLFETNMVLTFTGLHFTYQTPGTTCIVNYTSTNIMRLDPKYPNQLDLHTTKSNHNGMVTVSEGEQIAAIATGIAIQVFAVVIGVVTAGAGDVVVEGAADGIETVDETSALIDDVTVTFSEDAGDNAVGNISDSETATDAADDEATATADGDTSFKAKAKGWYARNKIKIKGGMKGMLIGAIPSGVITVIPKILKAEATGAIDDLPTLDKFTETAVAPVTWPGASTEFTVTSLALNGPLQLGGNPGFKDPSKS